MKSNRVYGGDKEVIRIWEITCCEIDINTGMFIAVENIHEWFLYLRYYSRAHTGNWNW